MKKLTALIVALIACVGLASITTAVAKPNKKDLRTKVTIRKSQTGPYNQYTQGFTGRVIPKGKGPARAKRSCRRNRVVILVKKGQGRVGSSVTNRRGRYAVRARRGNGPYTEPGRYRVRVPFKNRGGRIDCKKGKSRYVRVR